MDKIERGFSLIEVMIAVVIVAILAGIAVPSYQTYLVKSSREAAKTELLNLASVQEKIYLNSNAYTANLTTGYDGNSTGGLGLDHAQTSDDKYTIQLVSDGQSFTLTATPVAGGAQEGDGDISISSNGERLWNGAAW